MKSMTVDSVYISKAMKKLLEVVRSREMAMCLLHAGGQLAVSTYLDMEAGVICRCKTDSRQFGPKRH